MADIEHEPVKQAMDRLRELSADEEARRLAFVRERALRDEVSFLNEARRKGREEGLEQGRLDGERQVLRRQLARRFGPLPASAEQRLAAASADELERWADNILDAPSLDAVFSPPH